MTPNTSAAASERSFTPGEPILELESISLRFGGVTALTDVSFDVLEHEVRAIIGPNGAGKSSMLNVINGLYVPQHGSIIFGGRRMSTMTPNRAARLGIARTFQNIALFRRMTVLDNIMAGRKLHTRANFLEVAFQLPRARREETRNREAVEEIIEFLEIEHVRKTPAARLPYGLQKRVELGRALAAEPRVLLLDEPMAGMNIEEKQDMCRFILDVNDHYGTTIVLIETSPTASWCSTTARPSGTGRRTRSAPTRTSSTPISASRTETAPWASSCSSSRSCSADCWPE